MRCRLSVVLAISLYFYIRPQLVASEQMLITPPELQKIIAPWYPPLARLAGIQGVVPVSLRIGSECEIQHATVSGGPALLQKAVERSIRNPYVGLRFQSCGGDPKPVEIVFRFVLSGQNTNKWAPTYVHVQTTASGYEIEIKTSPGDLAALGLTKATKQ
jgi:hypothetical protein